MYTSRGGEQAELPDSEAGLYVETRKGRTVQVRIPPGHIAYQVGEVVQVRTKELPPTYHTQPNSYPLFLLLTYPHCFAFLSSLV